MASEAGTQMIQVVCKICFVSTNHKRAPTLTPESKSKYDTGTKKTKCTVCRQEWAPIRVAKELGLIPAKWVRIRNKPKIPGNVDFQQCNSLQKKVECPKGQDCSFAHSKIELQVWNQERQNEPRPTPQINGPYQFQLCKHILTNGTCPYGQRCTFAHSEQELTSWLQSQAAAFPSGEAQSNPAEYGHVPFHPGMEPRFGGGTDLKCNVCGLTCTSRRQLEDHFTGSKHKQLVASKALHNYNAPPPSQMQQPHPVRVRQRPTLSFPVNGYKMCLFMRSGKRCVYGDFCTFAHSLVELEEWNRQLQEPNTPRFNAPIMRFQNQPHPGSHGNQQTGVAPSAPLQPQMMGRGLLKQEQTVVAGLDDFGEEAMERQALMQDFGFVVRSQVANEHKAKKEGSSSVCSFEPSFNGVTVSEVSGQDLSLIWTQENNVEWMFQITVNSPQSLHSVVLFDTLASDYRLLGVWLTSGGQQRSLGGAKPMEGEGFQINVKLNPSDKILVKVSLSPRSGLLGQLVVFAVGQFLVLRGLAVHVLSQLESKLLADSTHSRKRKKMQKPDLYWEQHYNQMSIRTGSEEVGDEQIEEYPLPEQIEQLIEAGKYSNVENRVTKDNYKRRLHNLLYLEEYQQRVDMARYDLYDVEVTPTDHYSLPSGAMNIAPQGYKFVTLSVDEVLFEGGRSIRSGDGAQLLPKGQRVLHECSVEQVGRENVVLKISEKAQQACASSLNRCQVRFLLTRLAMRSMHFAVDHLDLDVIFPSPHQASTSANIETSPAIKKCLQELKTSELYGSQRVAVESMLDPACQQVPSLVLGPFGCGKTRTLSECAKLLTHNVPEARVLICTHTNSAASLYVESIHNEWNRRGKGKAPMFRLVFSGRRRATLSPTVQQYCKITPSGDRFCIPSVAELRQFKIVVATLSTSRTLYLSGVPRGHFTHIFIDEAAQALETESLIPMCLADKRTKVVLAGDHMQTDPPVYSEIARRYGLHVSMLERLYDHEAYDSGVGQLCKTLLTENHRSHPEILKLPSRLFYKNKLQCRAVFPSTGPKESVPPIKFVGVDGQETQDEDSPSFFNNHEGLKVAEEIQQLVEGGLKPSEICVISYYAKQVYNIRFILRQKRLGGVAVHRLDDVQGQEFRALLLTTVRTCSSELNSENEAGFLTDAKLFNTAITRAREWLIVVGEPITLCTVGSNRMCWLEFIKQCLHLGSFVYPKPQLFESLLENRLVSRQLLEKAHAAFFKEIRSLLSSPSVSRKAVPSASSKRPLTSAASQATPTLSQTTPTLTYLQSSANHQHQILRSKVKEASQSGDEGAVGRITEDLLRLTIEQQASLLSSPEQLNSRVREMEQVLRRAGPTAAVMSTQRMQAPLLPPQAVPAPQPPTTAPVPPPHSQGAAVAASQSFPHSQATLAAAAIGSSPLTAGLPSFLRQIIESVTIHAKWVEQVLQQNPALPPVARDNLMKQRNNVHQQMKLVNEQIYYYKEFLKVVKPVQPPNSNGPGPPLVNLAHSQPAPSTVGVMGAPNFGMIPPQMHMQQAAMYRQPPPAQTGILPGQTGFPAGVVRMSNHTTTQGVPMVNQVGVAVGVAQSQPVHFTHQSGINSAAPPPPPPQQQQQQQQQNPNSAFTYGVSAYFPGSQEGSQPNPPSMQTSLGPPGGGKPVAGKSLSPLEAAVTASASNHHASPQGHRHGNGGDVYYSDDENESWK